MFDFMDSRDRSISHTRSNEDKMVVSTVILGILHPSLQHNGLFETILSEGLRDTQRMDSSNLEKQPHVQQKQERPDQAVLLTHQKRTCTEVGK